MSNEKEYFEDEELNALAAKVIEQERLIHLTGANIKYVFVSPEISRTVHARCMRGTSELRHFGEFDFLIEFSHKIWQALDQQTKEILMFHELLHPVITQDKNGKDIFKIVKHDIMDFSMIINKYGVDWFGKFKDIISSTYEMKAVEKDQISI